MPTLRLIAAAFAACLCALGLSVGAAMAEGQHNPHQPSTTPHATLSGVCLLADAR